MMVYVYYTSNVLRNFSKFCSLIPPPSGSTASIHLAIAITCLGSLALTQTLPFVPTADSRGNRAPRRGRRNCCESRSLRGYELSRKGKKICRTYMRHILRLHRTMNPPFSSPNPSALCVWASKHSNSGSMSLWAKETRAYNRDPT